jgi:hypothetical protein
MLTGCVSPRRDISAEAQPWKEEYIENKILNKVSRKYVGWYLFHKGGSVSATIGEKNGYIAGPLWEWMIDEKGRLHIYDYDKKSIMILDLLFIAPDKLTARNEHGYILEFAIQNPNEN